MLDNIVLNIGGPQFSRILLDRLRASAETRQVTVYRRQPTGEFDLLIAAGDNPMTQNFIRAYHGLDATRRDLQTCLERSVEVCFLKPDAQPSDAFRDWWGQHNQAAERATILVRQPEGALVIDMFHQEFGGAFSDRARTYIVQNSGLLSSAIERHFHLVQPTAATSVGEWADRLRNLGGHAELSGREAMVCAYVLMGYSNEATSMHLGISPHSVSTYRRRAYVKLKITSQSELFAVLMHGGGAAPAARPFAALPSRSAEEPVFAVAGHDIDADRPEAAIQQSFARYCRALDRLDLPLGRKVWHPGGLANYEGYFEGTGHDFWDWTASQYPDRSRQLHRIGEPSVDIQGDEVSTETHASLVRLTRVDDTHKLFTAHGRYIDLWTRRRNQWGLQKRRYVRDFGYVQDVQALAGPAVPTAAILNAAMGRGPMAYAA